MITHGVRDPKRERAIELLAKRNEQCLGLLKSYGDAVEKIETSGVAVHPELGFFSRKEKVRAYQGQVRIKVTIRGFEVLGDLIARVSDQDMTALEGPWWKLRHDSPLHRQVRQEAARDAVARAREYAEAVGSRLLSLVELADEGLTTEAPAPGGHAAPAAAAVARARSTVSAPAPIDVEPQAQVVRARVEARFTISTPEAI
jgi:uncharacterized protein YggE